MFLPEVMIFVLAFLFYIGGIGIHILTIRKIIPYTLINGGRSESYDAQAKQSYISIVVLMIGLIYVFCGLLFPSFKRSVFFMVISFILALLWLLGTVMQLLGTKFERYFVSWLNIIAVLSHIELTLIYFNNGE